MITGVNSDIVRINLMLLLTAIIWGFAFVAQSVGMDFVRPFTFNAVRFPLGALSLVPVILYFDRRDARAGKKVVRWLDPHLLRVSAGAGLFIFGGASLQQYGITETTAGNAGFITGLYVVAVPIFGRLFLEQKTGWRTWVGVVLAIVGLYVLAFEGGRISRGDLWVLIGVLFWTGHVLWLDRYAAGTDAIKLACYQFLIVGLFSLPLALLLGEKFVAADIWGGALPIAYAAFLSTGVAYTLQVVAQKRAHPAHASIILSMESAFAALGGWLLLSEAVTTRILIGAGLMLIGMIISQTGADSMKEQEHETKFV